MSTFRLVSPLAALLLFAVSPAPARAQDAPPRVPNPLASLDKATLKGFVEMPLFEPSRHPPVAAAPVVVIPPPSPPPMVEPPPSLRLIGIVESSRSLAAIVHRNDTGRTETLRPGDRIGAWTVEVMPAALRVVSGGRAFDYAMFHGDLRQGPTIAARESATGGPR